MTYVGHHWSSQCLCRFQYNAVQFHSLQQNSCIFQAGTSEYPLAFSAVIKLLNWVHAFWPSVDMGVQIVEGSHNQSNGCPLPEKVKMDMEDEPLISM